MGRQIKHELSQHSKNLIKDNQDLVDKWCAGLRSGKYIREKYRMVDPHLPNSACCLMVMEIECNDREWTDHLNIFNSADSIASKPSELEGGVTWPQTLFLTTGEKPDNWNDTLDLNFYQIADLLEFGQITVEV